MGYENAPATRLVATHCCICSRDLVDAKSVEMGIGPVCRGRVGMKGRYPNRETVNKLVYEAAIKAHGGDVDRVLEIATEVDQLGMPKLAEILRTRFIHIRLEIAEDDAEYIDVYTPFSMDFVRALHKYVPHMGMAQGVQVTAKRKRLDDQQKFKCWMVRAGWKRGLLQALVAAYPGDRALGPKGVFTIPTRDEFDGQYRREAAWFA